MEMEEEWVRRGVDGKEGIQEERREDKLVGM